MYCLCVNVYCHRVTTPLKLINISSTISYHISYHIISYHIISHEVKLNQIYSRRRCSRFWGAKQQNFIHTNPHTRPAQYIYIKSIMSCSGCQQSHLVTRCGHEFPLPCLYLYFPLRTFIVTSVLYPPTCLFKPSSILSLLSSGVGPNLQFYTICEHRKNDGRPIAFS